MAKGTGTLLRNKPYTFVPLLPVRPEDRRDTVSHNSIDRRRLTGQLVLSLEVVTPLHIGSGSFRLINGQVARAFLRRGETPVIPGSSLKGAVRSLAEATSRSCLSQPPGRHCSRLKDALPPGSHVHCDEHNACIACRIFGFVNDRRGYRGRVFFSEFVPGDKIELKVRGLPALEQPFKDYPKGNHGCGNERLYYCRFHAAVPCKGPEHCPDCTKEQWLGWRDKIKGQLPPPAFRGRKFYLQGEPAGGNQPHEVAMSGSLFRGEVTFQNLDREELAPLCFALGLDGEIRLRLGYGKPAYMGTVRTRLTEVKWYTRERFAFRAPEIDPVALARDYGRDAPEILANVALLREILSGKRMGPAWGAEGY